MLDIGKPLAYPTQYRQMDGVLIHMVSHSDIAYAINTVHQFVQAPSSIQYASLL